MWIIFSLLSAIFSGLTTIFAKKGISDIDSELSSAIRTSIILIITFFIVCVSNSFEKVSMPTIVFIILSGISTALLWINYFKALDYGNVNEVTPVDKTSIVITLALSCILLNESITTNKVLSCVFILLGTFLMVDKKKSNNKKWLKYALATAFFTSISTIISKIGLKSINPILGVFYRTFVVFIIIWIYFYIKNKTIKNIKINKQTFKYLMFSGITTSLSWICYFYALRDGEASIVFPIEKLSIVVSIVLSCIILKEKMTRKTIFGLILIIVGIILLLVKL